MPERSKGTRKCQGLQHCFCYLHGNSTNLGNNRGRRVEGTFSIRVQSHSKESSWEELIILWELVTPQDWRIKLDLRNLRAN